MTHPPYAVLTRTALVGRYPSLVSAIEAAGKGATVYERLGHSTGVKIDHQAKLLSSLKWSLARLTNMTTDDEEAYAAAKAVIAEVEKYNAEVAEAIGEKGN